MLIEADRDLFVDAIKALPHRYKGLAYDAYTIRAGEDVPRDDYDETTDETIDGYLIVVSFIPGNKQYGVSINFFQSKRENSYYSNFAYGEDEYIVIRAFAKTDGTGDGRAIAQSWLNEMERYLKSHWDTIINGGYIDRGSFKPYREIYSDQTEHQFGYEMMFKAITTNSWTDEPEDPNLVVTPSPVEEIEGTLEDTVKIWVKI